MKKIMLFTAAILLCGAVSAQRHGMEHLLREGAEARQAQVTDLSGTGFSFNISSNDVRLDGLKVISFEDCPEPVKEQMNRAMRELDDPAYETWVNVSEDGEHVRVLAKKGREKIDEVVVLVCGDKPVMIRLTGDLNRESVLSVVQATR